MSEVKKIHLYMTSGCHLCGDALELIKLSKYFSAISITQIDIAMSDELIRNMGEKIPVIECADTQKKLFWPFSLLEFDQFFHTICL
ncbi:MAG: glutaredoxin family protein [Pseudomonadota bacterium]